MTYSTEMLKNKRRAGVSYLELKRKKLILSPVDVMTEFTPLWKKPWVGLNKNTGPRGLVYPSSRDVYLLWRFRLFFQESNSFYLFFLYSFCFILVCLFSPSLSLVLLDIYIWFRQDKLRIGVPDLSLGSVERLGVTPSSPKRATSRGAGWLLQQGWTQGHQGRAGAGRGARDEGTWGKREEGEGGGRKEKERRKGDE